MTPDVLIVLTNCPDSDVADRIARALVEQRLAACVNQLPSVRSIYRWQGVVEEANEVPLLIKTTAARYAEVEVAIRALHPYEVPEIVAWPVTAGFASYLDWVAEETRRPVRA
jgi:periplasmic divalent cation tolerance protein